MLGGRADEWWDGVFHFSSILSRCIRTPMLVSPVVKQNDGPASFSCVMHTSVLAVAGWGGMEDSASNAKILCSIPIRAN